MKKIYRILLTIVLATVSALGMTGCDTPDPIVERVSDLRSMVYEGESENYKIKASYGYKENPYINDGKVGQKEYRLNFKLCDKETERVTYAISFKYGEQEYSEQFKPSSITGCLNATFYIENFNMQEFSVTVACGSTQEQVNVRSLVKSNTLSYEKALQSLKERQPDLLNTYKDENGNYSCEIYARIIVKNEKSYWYIGIANGNNQLKALLIDGENGEILAIKEVI